MASPSNSTALILVNPHTSAALVKRSEERDPEKRWALTFSGFTLAPGRTLDRVYTVWGHALEKQANRVAHTMGMGPHATAQKLRAYFGDDEQRLLKLEGLRTCTPAKVRDYCANLVKYTLSTEAPTTRLRAYKNVVHLSTQFLGLRRIFLGCKSMQGATSAANISELWDPSLVAPNEEWSFWQGLAAACLSETTTSTLLEDTPRAKLTYCPDEGLSVIEQLLVEWDCSADSQFSAALCVRYLGGILNLPGFWAEMGAVHPLVAKKLCREMARALKDIGVDVLQLGSSLDETDPPFDYDGLDFLAAPMLVGLSGWFKKLDEQERPLQPWYDSLREILGLLRAPRSLDLLPQAAAYAVGIWETLLPLRSKNAELDVTARCEDDGPSGESTVVDSDPNDTPLASVTGDLLGDNHNTAESSDEESAANPSTSEAPNSNDTQEPKDKPADAVETDSTPHHADTQEDVSDGREDSEQAVGESSDLNLNPPPQLDDMSDGQATSNLAGEDSGGHRDQSLPVNGQGDIPANKSEDLETTESSRDIETETDAIPTRFEDSCALDLGVGMVPGTMDVQAGSSLGPFQTRDDEVGLKFVPQQYRAGDLINLDTPRTHSVLKEVIHKTTGKSYTSKIVSKGIPGARALVLNEFAILRRVSGGHPNIPSLQDHFETGRNFYLCLDLYGGGLHDEIKVKGTFPEIEAASLMRTIVSAIVYLHDMDVVHHNLKPNNLMFRQPEKRDILVTDFALGQIIDEEQRPIISTSGTRCYQAPEIHLRTPHGKPVDIWALGVISYFLLAGRRPFQRATRQAESDAIIAGDYKFEPTDLWASISSVAHDFIRACLTVDPARRPTAAEALRHEWFNEVTV